MITNLWETVWERTRANQHTVIVGSESIPSAPSDLHLLRVRCNVAWTTGGPLDDARDKVQKLLGEEIMHAVETHEQRLAGLRARVFDDMPVRDIDAVFVEACNRLAAWTEGRVALGFEAIDAADEATIGSLTQILRRPGWLRLPLLFAVRDQPRGPVIELVDVLRHIHGEEVVVAMDVSTRPDAPPSSFDWTTLPPDVRRILRAGAMLGSAFEADLIARLLDEPVGVVLEKLQHAADAGVALADHGNGRFFLPPEAIQALQSQMLPSLQAFWHARIGALLSERSPTAVSASAATPLTEAPPYAVGRSSATPASVMAGAPLAREQVRAADQPVTAESLADYAAAFEPATSALAPEALPCVEANGTDTVAFVPDHGWHQNRQHTGPSETPQPLDDRARAAAHLQASGQTEAAITQYLAAVQELAASGDARRACMTAERAIILLDGLPPSAPRMLLRAQLLLELGYVKWQHAILGSRFTLQDALDNLNAAKASLPDPPPPALTGRLATTIAGVCYDLGDLTALQQALIELTSVSRQLLEAGESMLAAQLLNDQAALYVRMGDPVRATHLLTRSRELFEALLRTAPDHPTAIAEMAETEHLLARLPLHTPIRSGREADAYAISLRHALAAENAYQRLNQPRHLARVWETIGRLEHRQGRLEAAQGRLETAIQLQKKIGDITGLARSAAGLADLYITTNQFEAAITLLMDSVGLNFEKGSPIGLAFNRKTFDVLQKAVRHEQAPKSARAQELLRVLEEQLVDAESVLGRIDL